MSSSACIFDFCEKQKQHIKSLLYIATPPITQSVLPCCNISSKKAGTTYSLFDVTI